MSDIKVERVMFMFIHHRTFIQCGFVKFTHGRQLFVDTTVENNQAWRTSMGLIGVFDESHTVHIRF